MIMIIVTMTTTANFSDCEGKGDPSPLLPLPRILI